MRFFFTYVSTKRQPSFFFCVGLARGDERLRVFFCGRYVSSERLFTDFSPVSSVRALRPPFFCVEAQGAPALGVCVVIVAVCGICSAGVARTQCVSVRADAYFPPTQRFVRIASGHPTLRLFHALFLYGGMDPSDSMVTFFLCEPLQQGIHA